MFRLNKVFSAQMKRNGPMAAIATTNNSMKIMLAFVGFNLKLSMISYRFEPDQDIDQRR
jgi:hypothetical protein